MNFSTSLYYIMFFADVRIVNYPLPCPLLSALRRPPSPSVRTSLLDDSIWMKWRRVNVMWVTEYDIKLPSWVNTTNHFLLSLFHTLTYFLWLSWPGFRFSISHSLKCRDIHVLFNIYTFKCSHSFSLYHPQPFHSPALRPTNVHSVWE